MKKTGGRILGQGKSGVVQDMCDASNSGNIETFCNSFENALDKISSVDLYTIQSDKVTLLKIDSKNEELNVQLNEILMFLRLPRNNMLVSKRYKSYMRITGLVDAKRSFMEEIDDLVTLIQKMGTNNIAQCTPIRFLKYKTYDIIGIVVNYGRLTFKTSDYITFSNKCDKSLEDICKNADVSISLDEFTGIINTILEILVKIQESSIAHGDLKPANIMKCEGVWKLIDWNMSRVLDFQTLMEKDWLKPKHRGSSPFYYMLHKFPYLSPMVDNYVQDFMMAQFHPDKFKEFKLFLQSSIDSFRTVVDLSPNELFAKFKNHGDLHSLGLVIYAINKIYFKSTKLEDFSKRLAIYNDDMLLTARQAMTAFSSTHKTNGGKKKNQSKKATWVSTGRKVSIKVKGADGKFRIVQRTVYTCASKPGQQRIAYKAADGSRKFKTFKAV